MMDSSVVQVWEGIPPPPPTLAKRCARRLEHCRQKEANKKLIRELMLKYDVDKSGEIGYDELKQYLIDLSLGAEPTKSDIRWVIQTVMNEVDCKKLDEEAFRTIQLKPAQIAAAGQTWMAFRETEQEISEVFTKHDTNRDGKISKEELKNVLHDLNEGISPLPAEVDFVMESADVLGDGSLGKGEFMYAISIWYTLEEQKVSQSECCTIL
eukprot:749242-Hanusia_phi.AAC.1